MLIVGVAIGYGIGKNSDSPIVEEAPYENLIVETKIIHDTIIKHEIVKISDIGEFKIITDTLTIDTISENSIILDSLKESYIVKSDSVDSVLINSEVISIKSDKIIKTIILNIIYIKQTIEKDSSLKTLLNINNVKNKTINVEFWESPINYKGYKLSKSKLIVYGLSPQFTYKLYKDELYYYLEFQNIFYILEETNDFLAFKSIDKSIIFHD